MFAMSQEVIRPLSTTMDASVNDMAVVVELSVVVHRLMCCRALSRPGILVISKMNASADRPCSFLFFLQLHSMLCAAW